MDDPIHVVLTVPIHSQKTTEHQDKFNDFLYSYLDISHRQKTSTELKVAVKPKFFHNSSMLGYTRQFFSAEISIFASYNLQTSSL